MIYETFEYQYRSQICVFSKVPTEGIDNKPTEVLQVNKGQDDIVSVPDCLPCILVRAPGNSLSAAPERSSSPPAPPCHPRPGPPRTPRPETRVSGARGCAGPPSTGRSEAGPSNAAPPGRPGPGAGSLGASVCCAVVCIDIMMIHAYMYGIHICTHFLTYTPLL